MFRPLPAAATAVIAVALAAPAVAHPKLTAATPAAGAVVTAPQRIELRFSERVMPPLSGATLFMTGMGGRSHEPMAMPGVTVAVGGDGASLILTPASPLPAGSYRIDWHVVSSDTHRIAGQHAFTVR